MLFFFNFITLISYISHSNSNSDAPCLNPVKSFILLLFVLLGYGYGYGYGYGDFGLYSGLYGGYGAYGYGLGFPAWGGACCGGFYGGYGGFLGRKRSVDKMLLAEKATGQKAAVLSTQ